MRRCLSCGREFEDQGWRCPACGFRPCVSESGIPLFAPSLARAVAGFDPAHCEVNARYEAAHFWFRARRELVLWALRAYFPNLDSLLEIGCGSGYLLEGVFGAFPAARLFGSEVLEAGLEHAAARLGGKAALMQLDAHALPFTNEFDVVAAFDVLEHIEADEAVLAEMSRATKPGGGIILTVPQHGFLWSEADVFSGHVRRYEGEDLARKVRGAGLRVLRSTSFSSLLMPLIWLRRTLLRKGGYDEKGVELQIPKVADGLFTVAARLDQALIALGANLPFGSSRLIVAAKDPAD